MLQNLVIAVGPPVMPWSCELPRASYRIGQPLRHSAALVSESLIWTRVTPDSGHPTALERRAGPGLVPGLARAGNHLITPELLAVSGIVTRDIAAMASHLARAA